MATIPLRQNDKAIGFIHPNLTKPAEMGIQAMARLIYHLAGCRGFRPSGILRELKS
jgi:hypothetical protein